MSEALQSPKFHVDESRGSRIAVSSGHRFASEVAVQTYLAGGNIIDAAIAGAAVLGIVLPYACGIGGDAFLLYRNAGSGKTYAFNGSGAAPRGATSARFAEGMPSTGIYAASIPGALALWEDALTRFGTRPLGEILQPAIAYACNGFPVHIGLIENIDEKRDLLCKDLECTRLFLDANLEIARPFVQSDLGRVLRTIAEKGAQEFYQGALADEFVGKIAAAGGLFTHEDMSSHRTLQQEPLKVSFYGYDVLTMPPNSVGVQLLLQLLALQKAGVHELDPDSLAFWRLTIEAWRWSVSISEETIGDPSQAQARAEELLHQAQESSADIRQVRAHPVMPSSGDTSNLVLMDEAGNCVSLVQSVSAPFSSGVIVPGTGILLNNRMRGFNVKEGSINCVAPGRRPKHTLVPVLVTRDGQAAMAIGTPGAAGQPLTLAQVLARNLACKQDMATAIHAPRWSVGLSGQLIVEPAAAAPTIAALRTQEPNLEVKSERHVRFGSVKAVTKDGDALRAVADFRRVAATVAS